MGSSSASSPAVAVITSIQPRMKFSTVATISAVSTACASGRARNRVAKATNASIDSVIMKSWVMLPVPGLRGKEMMPSAFAARDRLNTCVSPAKMIGRNKAEIAQ